MPAAARNSTSPGYGLIVPVILGLVSVALVVSALLQLGRNLGFAPPEDGPDRGRALGYVEDIHAAEGQVLELELAPTQPGRRPNVITARDDRPWYTAERGKEVRLLRRVIVSPRGYVVTEYIVDDFAAMWGGIIARTSAAVACDIAAITAVILGRRRRTAAERFPPLLPRRPTS